MVWVQKDRKKKERKKKDAMKKFGKKCMKTQIIEEKKEREIYESL